LPSPGKPSPLRLPDCSGLSVFLAMRLRSGLEEGPAG
jgi:hypothetical protein